MSFSVVDKFRLIRNAIFWGCDASRSRWPSVPASLHLKLSTLVVSSILSISSFMKTYPASLAIISTASTSATDFSCAWTLTLPLVSVMKAVMFLCHGFEKWLFGGIATLDSFRITALQMSPSTQLWWRPREALVNIQWFPQNLEMIVLSSAPIRSTLAWFFRYWWLYPQTASFKQLSISAMRLISSCDCFWNKLFTGVRLQVLCTHALDTAQPFAMSLIVVEVGLIERFALYGDKGPLTTQQQ